jgi:CRISPR/Cas system-associated endoribonuclease Cas2
LNYQALKNFIYLFLFCCYATILAQPNKFPTGEIIDSISVNKDSNESFSLYLPSQLNSSESSPIVFIFEPMARGKIGIYPFIKAAEKYGYILVCSNDSKNGPYEPNFEIANRLFNRVFSDFNIKKERVYTSGFSGGSRLASTIAVLTDQIQGVIACGAGFSLNKSHLPYKDSFSYAAIIGDEDMNFKEMQNTKDFLNRLKIPNELFVYEFNHSWPSQEQILDVFDWLQLEAYKKGIIPINKENIKSSYTSYYEKANQLVKNNQLLYASYEYERILRNFKKYYQLDSITDKLTVIKSDRLFKKEKKSLQSNFKEEVLLSDKFIDRFNDDFKKKQHDFKWWRSEIKKLNKKIKIAEPFKKKMLKRLQYKIFALSIETATLGNKIKHIDQSIFCYEICILIYPKYPYPYFKQVENYINKNNQIKALDYLEKLIANGYTNIQRIKDHKAFESLKNNERFMQLIKI